jgi:glycosyltransferase involved in cell wall biosynthesis
MDIIQVLYKKNYWEKDLIYDSLIVTNIPAFYKINLWNEVAKKSKIFVIFISSGSKIRTADFTQGEIGFKHTFLSLGDFEDISFLRALKLIKLIFSIPHKKLLICGWDILEYWVCAFLSPKHKNEVLVESSEHEGVKSGAKYYLKCLFVSRINKALVSGASQERLLRSLRFQNECVHTGGVGIFHKSPRYIVDRVFQGKFLCVARLSHEKNISFLLNIFAKLHVFSLSVAGAGVLEAELKAKTPQNVKFLGHLTAKKLNEAYDTHDVLLLPSMIEPWGLVVEEAIYRGMPVVVSDMVGCAHEMVISPQTGFVVSLEKNLWKEKMKELDIGIYSELSQNCYRFDFEARDKKQVEAFIG